MFESEGGEKEKRLVSDLEQSRNENIQYRRQVISELQTQVGQNVAQNDNDAVKLKQMMEQVETQKSIFDSQRKQLSEAEQMATFVKKQHKSGTGKQYRIETETCGT